MQSVDRELNSTPLRDGYRMPGEFEPHSGCIMIWPKRPGSWIYGAVRAREAFSKVARAIAESEKVYMLTESDVLSSAEEYLGDCPNIEIVEMESDDSWARDVGPTYVVSDNGVRGVNWRFNAWGGEVDGLYADWSRDDRIAKTFLKMTGVSVYDATPFVLEGGSIHCDGEGTVIVTERCLLSAGRNPQLTREQIEDHLREYLGVEKVIWLPYGIYNDETNEHVDNVCAYVRPGEVVLAWSEDEKDPQYQMSKADLEVLEREKDARGRSFKVHKLPIPAKPVCITEEELAGFVFEEGEDAREAGERLAASYANYYISNGGVILPQFGDENDKVAVEILSKCYPDRKIYPIYARDIIVGGGNIHCITQQIPEKRG